MYVHTLMSKWRRAPFLQARLRRSGANANGGDTQATDRLTASGERATYVHAACNNYE